MKLPLLGFCHRASMATQIQGPVWEDCLTLTTKAHSLPSIFIISNNSIILVPFTLVFVIFLTCFLIQNLSTPTPAINKCASALFSVGRAYVMSVVLSHSVSRASPWRRFLSSNRSMSNRLQGVEQENASPKRRELAAYYAHITVAEILLFWRK